MKTQTTFYDFDQHTPEWEAIRIGKVGGSEAVGLSTAARMKTLIPKKLAEILTKETQDKGFVSEDMQHGIDTEPLARSEFEKRNLVEVTQFGYITNDKYKYLGLSPDGLIGGMDSDPKKGIEIKCPLPKTHIEAIISGNIPTVYKPQIAQMFMVVETIEEVTFISYNEKVTQKPYYEITVTREEFVDEILKIQKGYFDFEKKIGEYLKLF
jgi:hypothetical protein